MTIKPIVAAAMLCTLCVPWQTATARDPARVAQNVLYVICAPKSGTAGPCVVREPMGPCPAPSAPDHLQGSYPNVQRACAAAQKLDVCRGGVSGC